MFGSEDNTNAMMGIFQEFSPGLFVFKDSPFAFDSQVALEAKLLSYPLD